MYAADALSTLARRFSLQAPFRQLLGFDGRAGAVPSPVC